MQTYKRCTVALLRVTRLGVVRVAHTHPCNFFSRSRRRGFARTHVCTFWACIEDCRGDATSTAWLLLLTSACTSARRRPSIRLIAHRSMLTRGEQCGYDAEH